MKGNLMMPPPPTELRWGLSYPRGRDKNESSLLETGSPSWRADTPLRHRFVVTLYRKEEDGDRQLYKLDGTYDAAPGFTYFSTDLFTLSSMSPRETNLETGSYFFTVKTVGDHLVYADSAAARSEVWTYTRPSLRLPSLSRVSWRWPDLYSDTLVSDPFFSCYAVKVYRETDQAPGQLQSVFSSKDLHLGPDHMAQVPILAKLPSIRVPGRYFFKLRALSRDIAQCQDGPWSPLSDALVVHG